ncbi:MAG: MFS transporter [Clostridium sp.]|uniref:MFS transporter n=1 Tax=Clostridium sp. TaxID=1506 RepID=UPI0039ED6C41
MKKLNYKKTFLLGFGFFAVSITWSVYNAFMPKLLSNFIASSALIGFIMTIDNYLALFIQPAVGMYSDRINTRFGKRMPFLMLGMPLAAIAAISRSDYGFYWL